MNKSKEKFKSTAKSTAKSPMKSTAKSALKSTDRSGARSTFRNVTDYSVVVQIEDKKMKIACGDGRQRLKWLTDVAIHLHDKNFGLSSGLVYGILNLENMELLQPTDIISTVASTTDVIKLMFRGN